MQTMHLQPGVAIQPNLELKTRPKPVLGSLPLAFALPDHTISQEDKIFCSNSILQLINFGTEIISFNYPFIVLTDSEAMKAST